jgi:flagellar biosynthetic protein FliO
MSRCRDKANMSEPITKDSARMHVFGYSAMMALVLVGNAAVAPGVFGQILNPAASQPSTKLPLRFVQSEARTPAVSAAARSQDPLPLAPPGAGAQDRPGQQMLPSTGKAVRTVVTSLAVVLGLLVALVWISKRTGSRKEASLPGEILETLGRAPLNGRQELQLVRVGNKLLLLSVTATTAETLTEITDPVEIDRLAGICRQNRPDSITASFREILSHHANGR